MKVVTINNTEFCRLCHELEAKVRGSFAPDAVVCIASGGTYVGKEIFRDLPHIDVSARRPSTKKKNSSPRLMAFVRALPLWARNMLRRAEAHALSFKKAEAYPIELPVSSLNGFKHILVVDDAIDSGATMLSVVRALNRVNPDAEIKKAVITVTTKRPLTGADFALFTNKTLIRFPWSNDNR